MGYVQQETFLAAGDIATNIRLANPLAEAAVVSAARQVGADQVVRRLAEGYSRAADSEIEGDFLRALRVVSADALPSLSRTA